MTHRRILEDLLQKPLGPYLDQDVLHETACQMKAATRLVLYSFVLECDGHVIGLDDSERPVDGEDDRRFRFRGILKISNPDWLSDFGTKTVETELAQRAQERALREGDRNPLLLKLEDLFDNKLLGRSHDATWREQDEIKLKILIQGERNMPATFMRSTRLPNGLLWSSKAHCRTYEVATMDVETYSRSENFFWRWRLVALMEKIGKQNRYVSPEKRTPVWFVDRYLAGYACPPDDKHRRLIFDESDSDMDEMGKTVTPRQLLKPHKSEILGLFAAHAEWLITHEIRKDLFDISSWKKFAKRVREERREAARHGVRWGLPMGDEVDEDEEMQVHDDEFARKLAREQPVIGRETHVVARQLELGFKKAPRRRASFSSNSGSEGFVPAVAEYASDYSDPSDAEDDQLQSGNEDAEDEAVKKIPWELQLPPLLPDIDGRWWCPLPRCKKLIDLNDPPEEEGRGVPEIGYILQKQWRNPAYDDEVVRGFCRMVTNHYSRHLEDRGVRVERKDGKTRFTTIQDGPRHAAGRGPIRGPMPPRGTLGGESRVVPTVHTTQDFQRH